MNTPSSLELIKTYRFDTDSNETAMSSKSQIVRFCVHTIATFAPIVDKLSEAYLKAQLSYQDGVRNKDPAHVSVIIPKILIDRKYKEGDQENFLERILFFIENFKVPSGGIIVSVYSSDMDHNLDSHWSLSNVWETKSLWKGDGSYVTVNLPESGSPTSWNKKDFYPIWNHVKDYLKSQNIEIKYISYDMRTEDIYKLLIHSQLHISYVGASYIFSTLTKTPTLGLGYTHNENNYIFKEISNLKFFINGYPKNLWGTGPMQNDRVMQVVGPNLKVGNDFIHHVKDCNDKENALKYTTSALNKNYSEFLPTHNFEKVEFGEFPWPHITIDDFLPEQTFEKMREDAMKIQSTDNEMTRQLFNYDPTPQIGSILRTFMDNKGVKIRKFDANSLKKFIHFAVTPRDFVHKKHIEAEFKIMSAVLYLGPETNIGTRLYETVDSEEYIEVEWKPNRLVVFCGHDNTWHDFASTDTRYTYNYFLVDSTVVQNEDYKNNLI